MKLLALSTWFPYPPDNGSRIRAFHLLRELARAEHRVYIIAGVQPEITDTAPAALTEWSDTLVAVPWRWYDASVDGKRQAFRALISPTPRSILATPNLEMEQAIQTALKTFEPDALLVLELGMDAYLPPTTAPMILEQAEVSGVERAYREAKGTSVHLRTGLTYAKSQRYWRERFRRYSAITAVSEAEAEAVRRVAGDTPQVHVIPNGVAVDEYVPRSAEKAVPGRLIYNGALTYAPNREAVTWFVREILPKVAARVPEAHLVVTGRFEPEQAAAFVSDPRVHLTGFLADLRPALAEAMLCVVPLQTGGGTRLKILEAWAAGLPVVSTPIGAAGLDAEDGRHLLLAETAEAFADAVVALLSDPVRATRMAENARALVLDRYEWKAIGARLSDLLVETASLKR